MVTSFIAAALMTALIDEKPTVKVEVKGAKDGVVTGTVTVGLPKGWHAYQNPPKSEYENPLTVTSKTKGLKLTKVVYPKGHLVTAFGNESLVYEGTVKVTFTGKVDKALKLDKGEYKAELDLGYQLCNDSTCIPPASMVTKISWKPVK